MKIREKYVENITSPQKKGTTISVRNGEKNWGKEVGWVRRILQRAGWAHVCTAVWSSYSNNLALNINKHFRFYFTKEITLYYSMKIRLDIYLRQLKYDSG